jgi:hypothetical protein
MSTLSVNTITDASGGNTAKINTYTPTESNMMGKNRIINGDMRIDQRNAGASVTNAAALVFSVDRWGTIGDQASKFTAQQSSTAPSGFTSSVLITSSSAYTVGASDSFIFRQAIEGTNIADLGWGTANAKTVTLSFWVRSSLTGTFGGSLRNNAADRSYPFTYTISVADTWEYKTITIAGETSGTWLITDGRGINAAFSLGAGASVSGTAGSWASANYTSATGATSVVGTNGATWYVTGVQLEVGSVATPFERRPYGAELALCQRYYAKLSSFVTNGQIMSGFSTSSTAAWCQFYAPVQLRASPTFNYSNLTVSDQVNYGLTITAIAGSAQTSNGGGVSFTNNSGATQYRPCAINTSSSSGFFELSAEL